MSRASADTTLTVDGSTPRPAAASATMGSMIAAGSDGSARAGFAGAARRRSRGAAGSRAGRGVARGAGGDHDERGEHGQEGTQHDLMLRDGREGREGRDGRDGVRAAGPGPSRRRRGSLLVGRSIGARAQVGSLDGPRQREPIARVGLGQRRSASSRASTSARRRYWRTTCDRDPIRPCTAMRTSCASSRSGSRAISRSAASRAPSTSPASRRWAATIARASS